MNSVVRVLGRLGATKAAPPARLLSGVARHGPSMDTLWNVGSFPIMASAKPAMMLSTHEMLLHVSNPALDVFYPSLSELITDMGEQVEYHADSVLKKRRKKMNKHKHKKRVKALRDRTKKN
ncbi:hypothetical protein SDRG_09948 [Saprolegnia diclina VS20]|uniref:Small ribosomal subunit protein mS38 n=1 Tax=Saprolegnia diclina (strain VS20) TaxID=1156394 RepID=T0QBW2_SAPDV|nr:hypothetical protein SDRG_09948 [Saprolegnia diclina VS20]EQC32196.1 hypothetical protein SDRG_09948 [Saprolegnia diclina VS20]|eukprot:XP_008614137.1 hypothetical protein SDRG_09948 [Saprolegnia diclina VS20]